MLQLCLGAPLLTLTFSSYKNDFNLKCYVRRSKLQTDKNEQGNLIFSSSSRLSHKTAEENKQTRECLKINVINRCGFSTGNKPTTQENLWATRCILFRTGTCYGQTAEALMKKDPLGNMTGKCPNGQNILLINISTFCCPLLLFCS